MAFRVSIDRTLCDSQALCVTIAPAVFALDDDDINQVLVERPEGDLLARAQLAANACPKGAITLTEE